MSTAPPRPDFSSAPCRDVDLDVFFPVEGESPVEYYKAEKIHLDYLEKYDAARPVCAECPIRPACRDWAIATGAWYGYFGGMTPVERYRYAQRHPEIPAAMPEPVSIERERLADLPGLDLEDANDRARARAADLAYADRETEVARW